MNSKTNSKYTEDWLPVKNISNGMIELDNKFSVTGVKVRPRNIFILDSNSRASIISQLRVFYSSVDFEFWLISADRPVDISSYLATLQIQYNNEQDPRIKKIISQDIEKANMFMRDNVTDTEFYILFKEKDQDRIQKKLRTLMLGLSNAGLDSVQVSNSDLRVILDGFLNAGMNTENKAVLPQ
jgi:hypothetical protein